jgi:hypothetical protein
MPEAQDALELVAQDVQEGMGRWLRADDDSIERAGFRVLEPFDVEREGIRGPETGTVAVPWAWVGRHEEDVMGFAPTGQVVELRGVTLVRDTEAGPAFSRFVDWVSALGQMGVGLWTRPVVDEGPPRPPDLV